MRTPRWQPQRLQAATEAADGLAERWDRWLPLRARPRRLLQTYCHITSELEARRAMKIEFKRDSRPPCPTTSRGGPPAAGPEASGSTRPSDRSGTDKYTARDPGARHQQECWRHGLPANS